MEDNMTVLLLDASLGLTALYLRDMHCAFSLPQKVASSALTGVAQKKKETHSVPYVV